MNPNPKQVQHDVDLGQEAFKDVPVEPARKITFFDDADIAVFDLKHGQKND